MQRYAEVHGQKQLPFPKGRGTCPCCGGLLIAKCGQVNAHHWAHDKRDDCDTWSEPLGPWHLWWQGLVRPDFIEVVRGPHRADIFNGHTVVQLQHSSISAEDIAAREAFYGDMVWLFDATERFNYMKSGGRAFFSFGQTKHLELCKKPVFLDFGFEVVQVEQFTDAITMVSGFGLIRSREWFADAFLSDVRQSGSSAGELFVPEPGGSAPWAKKSPVWVGDSQNKRYDYDNVINSYPGIANGWTRESLRQMMQFFCGEAILLGGTLRVLPHAMFAKQPKGTVSTTENLLRLAEEHINAGHLPCLKDATKQALLAKAREGEISQ